MHFHRLPPPGNPPYSQRFSNKWIETLSQNELLFICAEIPGMCYSVADVGTKSPQVPDWSRKPASHLSAALAAAFTTTEHNWREWKAISRLSRLPADGVRRYVFGMHVWAFGYIHRHFLLMTPLMSFCKVHRHFDTTESRYSFGLSKRCKRKGWYRLEVEYVLMVQHGCFVRNLTLSRLLCAFPISVVRIGIFKNGVWPSV